MESPRVSIRDFEIGDIEAVRGIANSAYAVYIERIGKRPEPMDLDYRQVASEQSMRIACVGDTPAGFIAYTMDAPGDQILIHNLAIHPACRRLGLGSLLLDSAETFGSDSGMRHSNLYTNAAMVENLAFYKKRGYEVLQRRTVRGYDRIFLRKNL